MSDSILHVKNRYKFKICGIIQGKRLGLKMDLIHTAVLYNKSMHLS